MTEVVSGVTFTLALLFYGAASAIFFLDVARSRARVPTLPEVQASGTFSRPSLLDASTGRLGAPSASTRQSVPPARSPSRHAPLLLGLGALGHAGYVTLASFVAHVCPIHSVHFMLSVASLLAIAVYLVARLRFPIDAIGMLIGPLGLAFLLGTFFLGKPGPVTRLSPFFIAAHVMANLLGIALFLLAGAAAALYLVQEKRLKRKRSADRLGNLPPLDTLDRAVHRFLIAGFPLLTLGIVTGTFWAQKIEMGSPEEIMRIVFSYATWLLIALVLLLRAAAGWRGRRAAYGTIAGLACAAAVLIVYLVRPSSGIGG
jgi:ABC-type uncharacterized transport system permease subunit